ncbi:helix-turn-helix transcriptional regulator [Roseibacillus persicicus]|uniref:HTH araC/xylS-type domain-containing protein n=1 Tax=Roseibacillus persicicus TaxID=454148 RepID=A0A918TWJ9_9BACT|nr:helix-turn-helix transcriptional regulator [Roseibacillus persicicus]GHC62075.1 hypothetical protein GCM10007100_31800 [Roseibacillus persicicus]
MMIPIESILFVDEIAREELGRFHSASTPQHLLHVTLSGEVSQLAGGQVERFREGDVTWYHEAEPIEGEILRAPWRFITIGFVAPRLSPPSLDRRVLAGGERAVSLACELLEIWRDPERVPMESSLLCTARLAELLLEVTSLERLLVQEGDFPLGGVARWWQVERVLRQRLEAPFKLEDIANLAGLSPRTVNRACRQATGCSPVKRLRILRLSHARGLLQHTGIPVTEIAFRMGYARVQEFSRDFKKQYQQSPTEARREAPDYQQVSKQGPPA